MKEMTYDEASFKNIKELISNGNIAKASSLLNKYLQVYPNDGWARLELVRVLKYQNRLEEAIEQALYIKSSSQFKEFERLEKYVNLEIWNVYVSMCEFEKALEYLPFITKFRSELSEEDEKKHCLDELYLRQRLGILTDEVKMKKTGYLASQIINYSEEDAIRHISEHKLYDPRHPEYGVFEEEIDISCLYYQVKEALKTAEPNCFTTITSKYYFEYPKVVDENLKEDLPYKYLTVITFKDTNKIITMYPCFSKERVDIVNSLVKENKIKKLSQIEKFNKKYGKME